VLGKSDPPGPKKAYKSVEVTRRLYEEAPRPTSCEFRPGAAGDPVDDAAPEEMTRSGAAQWWSPSLTTLGSLLTGQRGSPRVWRAQVTAGERPLLPSPPSKWNELSRIAVFLTRGLSMKQLAKPGRGRGRLSARVAHPGAGPGEVCQMKAPGSAQRRDDSDQQYKGACPFDPHIMGHEGPAKWRRSARMWPRSGRGTRSA